MGQQNRAFYLGTLVCLAAIIISACKVLESRGSLESTPLVSSFAGFIRADFPNRDRALYEARGQRYMVVTQGPAASLAAKRMLDLGGNVIDAAAAASFALAVERPQSTGLGGGGFVLARLKGEKKIMALDFREVAPKLAQEGMFLDARGVPIPEASTDGGLASGVPGMVSGVLALQAKFGKLTRQRVLEPAIELAEQGFLVYPHLAVALAERQEVLAKSTEARQIFFEPSGKNVLGLGARLYQKNLAKVLRSIAREGADGFYKGWVAAAIVAEQQSSGGLIRLNDLAQFREVWREPAMGQYRDYTVYSMPPPSSGGIHIVEMLQILSGFPVSSQAYSLLNVHRTASAMQIAYRDRARYLGDSDFVRVPEEGLLSPMYADAWRAQINDTKALKLELDDKPAPWPYESHDTTHFTIADAEGNVISSTQTINGWFGSGQVVSGTGIVMNNEMDDFSVKPGVPNKFGVIGGKENAVAPGKRPLSSMSPTIVMKGHDPVMALGSPAGSQIINCVLLTLRNYLDFHFDLWDAVTALRYHQQWRPDRILVEGKGFDPTLTEELEALGHKVEPGDIGCKVQTITYEAQSLHGVSDPRGEGLAVGENVGTDVRGLPPPREEKVLSD